MMVPEPEGHKNEPETKRTWLKWHEVKGKNFNEIIESAEELGRDYFVAGVSGGKDSVSLVDKLDRIGKLKGVFHIDTATGVQVTQDFVKDLCQSRGWTLYMREPTPFRFVYVALVLQVGFPGPDLHPLFMNFMKYKVMKKFVRESYFEGKGLALVSGVRQTESIRRMGNYETPINQDGKMWQVCPWFYESTENIYRYFIENGLKKTPAHEELGHSGECGCGSFAGHGEGKQWRKVDPMRARMFEWLEEGIQLFGTPLAKKHAKWGGQGVSSDEAQTVLMQFPGWEHFMQVQGLVCGAECGSSTMRGAGLI